MEVAGKPDLTLGVQVDTNVDLPEPEHRKGEVRISGNKKSVIPCVDLEPVYGGEGVIGEGSRHSGERIDKGKKDRGCRIINPRILLKLMAEVPASHYSTAEVMCAGLGIKQESECDTFRRLEDFAALMGFVKSLRVERGASYDGSSASLPGDYHPVMETFVHLFINERLSKNLFYEVRLYAINNKLYLHIKQTQPVTLPTPDIVPDKKSPFDQYFDDQTLKLTLVKTNDGICIELDGLESDGVISGLIEQLGPYDPFNENYGMKFLIRFRGKIPDDQVVSKVASYRLVTGSTNRNQLYYSYSAPVRISHQCNLFIEFQLPFLNCPDPNLDEIFDVHKEFKSTRVKLVKNPDGSINNQHNRELLHQKSIPIARKARHVSPQKNVLINEDDRIGSGIAQDVRTHGEYPDVAVKRLRRTMLPYQAGISINTLNVTQNLASRVMTADELNGKSGEIKCVLSPIDYKAVVGQDSTRGDGADCEVDFSSTGATASDTPKVVMRLRNSQSECEAFNDAFNSMDLVSVPLRPEDDELIKSGSHGVVAGAAVNGAQVDQESHEIKGYVTVLGMQKKYDQSELVEYILKDPNEKPAVKSEIIKGILDLIDRCDRFNKRMEQKGNGRVIKCVIDGNFANFAYDRNRHQLIYLDVAPATVMIDGQILPGNQFMMDWPPERHDFISKMSEDPQMSKLFVLVMLTNDLRQLEKIESRLESESIYNKLHESKIRSLGNVINTVSTRLAEDDGFLSWCAFHFLSGAEMNLEGFRYHPKKTSDVAETVSGLFGGYLKGGWVDYGESTWSEAASENLRIIKSLPFTRKEEFLRMMSDVVFNHMRQIKKSLAERSVKQLGGESADSDAITENILPKVELEEMMRVALNGNIEHFFSSDGASEEMFFEVAFMWLEKLKVYKGLKPLGGERVGSAAELKEQLKRDVAELDAGDSEYGSITVPCFLRMMNRVYGEEINVILIEPFYGHDKLFRTGIYEWKSVSQDEPLCLEECTGLEAFHRTLKRLTMDTMVLVNHQPESSYLIGDVSKYRWSTIFVKEKGSQHSKLTYSLGVTYTQCQDGYAKVFFEKIVHGLKELYEERKKVKSQSTKSEEMTDRDFLKKLIEWVPENCSEISKGAAGAEEIFIKMNLSSSIMYRLKPWLRGYIDMIQHEFGKERSPRIYIVMPLPSRGTEDRKCARWVLRLTKDENGNDISFMDFNSELTMDMLLKKIHRSSSRPGASSKPDLMFIEKGYGSGSSNFLLYDTPEVRVQSGYESARKEIAGIDPEGRSSEPAAVGDQYVFSHEGWDPDAMNSLECEHEVNRQVYKELCRFQEH